MDWAGHGTPRGSTCPRPLPPPSGTAAADALHAALTIRRRPPVFTVRSGTHEAGGRRGHCRPGAGLFLPPPLDADAGARGSVRDPSRSEGTSSLHLAWLSAARRRVDGGSAAAVRRRTGRTPKRQTRINKRIASCGGASSLAPLPGSLADLVRRRAELTEGRASERGERDGRRQICWVSRQIAPLAPQVYVFRRGACSLPGGGPSSAADAWLGLECLTTGQDDSRGRIKNCSGPTATRARCSSVYARRIRMLLIGCSLRRRNGGWTAGGPVGDTFSSRTARLRGRRQRNSLPRRWDRRRGPGLAGGENYRCLTSGPSSPPSARFADGTRRPDPGPSGTVRPRART